MNVLEVFLTVSGVVLILFGVSILASVAIHDLRDLISQSPSLTRERYL